jgi:myo-inositol-1(or 4)-monophosphatase
MVNYEHLIAVAKEAAGKATQALVSMDDISLRYKYDDDFPREMKAEVDFKLEEIILDCLKPTGIPILSEESSGHSKFNYKGLYWLVDPLDGTVNFIRGIAPCAVSIALWLNNQPVFGVISEYPSLRLAWGGSLFGAFIDGEPIHVSVIENKSQAVLCTGFPSRLEFSKVSVDSFLNMASSFGKVRMLGAASLSLLQVAKGSADAYLEEDIMIWDIAAGLAIIEGAGGNIKILPGRFQLSQKIIASNGLIQLE